MAFIFGQTSRTFNDASEILLVLGSFVSKQYIDSYSCIFPPLTISQVKARKAKNGAEIHKIQVSFYYMTYNSAGVAQFAWYVI